MKELLELRVNFKYAHLLFKDDEGVNLGGNSIYGPSIKVVKVDTGTSLWIDVCKVSKLVYEKYKECFFYGWEYQRKYTTKELAEAKLFQMNVRKYFEPAGEECGTIYDESCACRICGSGRKQISPLRLKKGRFLNKRDVATTIADEIVVSRRFVDVIKSSDIKGMFFGPVYLGNSLSEDVYQLMIQGQKLEMSEKTRFGGEPYDFIQGEEYEREISGCPNGDHLGLNILSEAYVHNSASLSQYDFFISKETVGNKITEENQGSLIRPSHLLFCSPKLYRVIKENNLKGFNFEVAHVVG